MPARPWKRTLSVCLVATTFVVASFLWVWNSEIFYRMMPRPGISIGYPFGAVGVHTNGEGVQFIATSVRAREFLAVQFSTGRAIESNRHYHAYVINLLGVVVAIQPTQYNGGDYIVQPYASLLLPYWLLIVGSGALLVVLTPAATWIHPYCRLSRFSGSAAAVIVAVFVMLNFVPLDGKPGPAILPKTLDALASLILNPRAAHSNVMLSYGFPFLCHRRGIINGQNVSSYYGAETGFDQHKAMENVCVAALTAFAAVLVIEAARCWAKPATESQETSL